MKKWIALLLALVMMLTMMACGCKHEFTAADCVNPKTCTLCGETVGEAMGHSMVQANCEKGIHCDACDLVEGEPLGHEWMPATLEAPKTCQVCAATEGKPISIIGQIRGEIYHNPFFGFEYKLVDGLKFSTDEELQAASGMSEALSELNVVEYLRSAEEFLNIMDAHSNLQRATIELGSAKDAIKNKQDIKDYLYRLRNAYVVDRDGLWEEQGLELVDIWVHERTFCGTATDMLEYTFRVVDSEDVYIYCLYFCVLKDGYLACITLTGTFDSMLDGQLNSFSAIPAYATQPETDDAEKPTTEEKETANTDGLPTFQLKALPGTLSVDDGYNVYSLDNGYTQEMCDQQGIEKSTVDNYMPLCGYDMIILPEDTSFASPEFCVYVRVKEEKDYGVTDFKQLSNAEFKATADLLVAGFAVSFDYVSEYTVYENETAKYVVFDLDAPVLGPSRRYATIINGKMVYFIGEANGEKLSAEQDKQMQMIIDSLRYS